MRLPGFTAENSLRPAQATYQPANIPGDSQSGGVVQPQFLICHGNVCCDEWGYCVRKGHVLM